MRLKAPDPRQFSQTVKYAPPGVFCYSKKMDAQTLIANIRSDSLAARKERDAVKSQALLSLLNAIDNASAVDAPVDTSATEVARRVLSVDDVKQIINNEINEMQEAAAIYKDIDTKQAEELEVKIATLKNYKDFE